MTADNCPLCGAPRLLEYFHLGAYGVNYCRDCSVEFLHPQPDANVLAKIYSANYFLSDREGVEVAEVNRLKRTTAELYVDQILSTRGNQKGKLLEIGCGTGDFLMEAQSRGFEVTGIETSADATATANQRLGAPVVKRGEIETVNLLEAEYDAAVFSDVIEHVPDPRRFLSAINRCLRPGGLVFIVTPSTDSWSRRLMGRRWMEYKLEHLFYFNRKSLGYLLTSSGFSKVAFEPNTKILSFEYIRAHFRKFRVPFWTPLIELTGGIIPTKLARKHLRIVASGMVAIAKKVN